MKHWWAPWSLEKTSRAWSMVVPHVIWALWKERNTQIFKEHNQMVEEIIKTCLNLLVENI